MAIFVQGNGWVVYNRHRKYDVVDYINHSFNLREEFDLDGPVNVYMSEIEHYEDATSKQFFVVEFVGDGIKAAQVFDKIIRSLKEYFGRSTPMEIEATIKFIE